MKRNGFSIEKNIKGFRHHTKYKMSLRASETGELVFDVFVPDENVFPEIRGWGLFMCFNSARYGIAWALLELRNLLPKASNMY